MNHGQEKEFDQLFERYSRPLWLFFKKRGCADEECEDLTQETFLRTFKGMEQRRGDSSVATWLYTIAANIWCNRLRGRSTAKRTGQEVSFDRIQEEGSCLLQRSEFHAVSNPFADALTRERLDVLHKEIGNLPPQMRQCLILRIAKGRKYDEIAILMGVSINTVKSQISQGRERLKKKLAEIEASRTQSARQQAKEA